MKRENALGKSKTQLKLGEIFSVDILRQPWPKGNIKKNFFSGLDTFWLILIGCPGFILCLKVLGNAEFFKFLKECLGE